MATRSGRIILTYDDYARLPEDGRRYELYEGEIQQMAAAPNRAHQRAVGNLYAILRDHVRRHRLGEVFVAPYDVVLSELTVLQPDLLYISRARQDINLPQHVRGAPDLVVEVLSPSTEQRDQQIKRQLYAQYGVPNYWLFDPERREATGYTLHADSYREAAVARESESFTAPPFADLPIPFAEIWE